MYLIQILLPLYNPSGEAFPEEIYSRVREELTEKFGGITAFVRSPAVGLWKENGENTVRDDVVIYEVMAEEKDQAWWQSFREQLTKRFEQDELVVRVMPIQLL